MGTHANYRSTATIHLDGIQIDHIEQDAGDGYRRLHDITEPTLVYMLPTGDRPALGSFDPPISHQSFRPFGTMLALPPNQPLHVFSPPNREREMIVLQFERSIWSRISGISDALQLISFERWADIRSPGLLATLDRISLEIQRPDRAQAAVLSGLALLSLGELLRHLEEQNMFYGGQLASWQLRKIELLLAREGPMPSVADLASICGISARHLGRVFKQTTGETVMHYAERVRFERARKMLAQGTPIKQVAAATGFASQASFSTSFRRQSYLTPSAFRKRCNSAGELRDPLPDATD